MGINMKILNLMQCLNLGGMEQSAYILMRETHEKMITWQVQSITPGGVGKKIAANLNIPAKDNLYIGKFGWRSYFELKRKILEFIGDIILVTGPSLTSCLAIKGSSYKKVLGIHFCHGSSIKERLKWKLFYNFFGKDYDAIIYHSQYILEEAKQIAPYLEDKFHLVEYSTQHCSITSEKDKRTARQHLDIPTDKFIIGNAGWLIERKRFDIFLQVCAKISKSYPNVFYLIAGDGPMRQELEILARDLGIIDKVKFLGWQEVLHTFYQALDLVLFNSNSDAFGRTVMEAMGYGVPVVASVLEGGTDSVIIHKENGYLIPKHEIEQLAEYCLKLINEQDLYNKFQLASIETIRKRFSNDLYVQKYLEVFNDVLKAS
ncbi:hypothetical protein DSM106972_041970 [Dulcicalothrix desertica PCC 7102]|uniref:Glycosyl transferase family 1 domain-containing protein n=2 Tax=Dulcicalothrix desertica TaxID=32056 RepID=A0A3S1CMI9_9CYAN|nr:hypothetical protein DSM106972_041970 [Dulcicalothrix desertica PCC 7102]TWH42634.1 glycosyltransferase involved in cell wall biosynthesis [Dulcicalothrix desertica PCC 7102]